MILEIYMLECSNVEDTVINNINMKIPVSNIFFMRLNYYKWLSGMHESIDTDT